MGKIKDINIKNRTYYYDDDKMTLKIAKNRQEVMQKHCYFLH